MDIIRRWQRERRLMEEVVVLKKKGPLRIGDERTVYILCPFLFKSNFNTHKVLED